MTIRREAVIRVLSGVATDEKPYVGQVLDNGYTVTAADMPVGTLFQVRDTRETYKWSGGEWLLYADDLAVVRGLAELTAVAAEGLAESRVQTALLRALLAPATPDEGV